VSVPCTVCGAPVDGPTYGFPRVYCTKECADKSVEGMWRAPVPRGHCNRCDRCGWGYSDTATIEAGCRPPRDGGCSMRPLPERRSTCAGCGANYEPVDVDNKDVGMVTT